MCIMLLIYDIWIDFSIKVVESVFLEEINIKL